MISFLIAVFVFSYALEIMVQMKNLPSVSNPSSADPTKPPDKSTLITLDNTLFVYSFYSFCIIDPF